MAKKTGIASIAERRSDMFWMDPNKIHIRAGWNSRDFDDPANLEQVEEMAQSIKANGVKQPLAGFYDGDQFVLTDGETRLRAIKMLGASGHVVEQVPVISEDRNATPEDHMVMQVVRNSGRPFTPIENANLFLRLSEADWSLSQIADKTGFTAERVGQLIKLALAPAKIKKFVQQGRISPTLAGKVLAKHKKPADAVKAITEMVAKAKGENKLKATERHLPKDPSPDETNAPKLNPPVDQVPATQQANARELLAELLALLTDETKSELPADRLRAFEEAVGGAAART